MSKFNFLLAFACGVIFGSSSSTNPLFSAVCDTQSCSLQLTIDANSVVSPNLDPLYCSLSSLSAASQQINNSITDLQTSINNYAAVIQYNETVEHSELVQEGVYLDLINAQIAAGETVIEGLSAQASNLEAELQCLMGGPCPSTFSPTPTATGKSSSTPPTGQTTSQNPTVDLNWWKKYPVYQIYPRSFQDSNGDGTGDIRGVMDRLDYLEEIGIRIIWFNPIYESPMKDFGYDISNYTKIDPLFGTLQDFQDLVADLHRRGMYIVMDFVPNHSSDQHPWFQQSKNNTPGFSDYYIWLNGTYNSTALDEEAPNNWLSSFGNSSWEWYDSRNQFNYHVYLIAQPDLNYRSQGVRREMQDALQYWLDEGVDGFRMDAIRHLVENDTFLDEPLNPNAPDSLPNEYDHLLHIYTNNQPLTYDVVQNWTTHLRNFGLANNKHIFTVLEASSDTIGLVMEYYNKSVDFPFNFDLTHIDDTTTASEIRTMISRWMDNLPLGKWPNWVKTLLNVKYLFSQIQPPPNRTPSP